MKILFLIITLHFLLGLSNGGTAQAPNWLWAQSAGGTHLDYGNRVSADAAGNVFITGNYLSLTITFGTTTLTNGGSSDIFIVKFDENGNVLWAKSVGGTGDDLGIDVSVDVVGNVFITGYFSGPTITFGTTTLINSGMRDIFVVKYDTNGNLLWAKSGGGSDDDYALCISSDNGGNVFISGRFDSPTITFGTTSLNNAGWSDIFIVKYDSNGSILWARSEGGAFYDNAYDVCTDSIGNVFLSGNFNSPTITFGAITLTRIGDRDVFIVKYDPNGNVIWAKSAGSTGTCTGVGVSTDATGNAFMIGWFDSPTVIFGTTTLTNAGWSDIFIVKYDSSGSILWAKSAGGIEYDSANDISTDSSGNVIVVGWFDSPTITFDSTNLTSAGLRDIYLVKYDSNGNIQWTKGVGGTNNDYEVGVSADISGNIFVTGSFQSPAINFGTTTLTNAGIKDIFVAKLDSMMTTGFPEQVDKLAFEIAPNPFTSQTTISVKEEQQNSTLKLMDVLGKEIINLKFSGTQFILEKGEMPVGIYIVQLIDENKIVTRQRIVIQ